MIPTDDVPDVSPDAAPGARHDDGPSPGDSDEGSEGNEGNEGDDAASTAGVVGGEAGPRKRRRRRRRRNETGAPEDGGAASVVAVAAGGEASAAPGQPGERPAVRAAEPRGEGPRRPEQPGEPRARRRRGGEPRGSDQRAALQRGEGGPRGDTAPPAGGPRGDTAPPAGELRGDAVPPPGEPRGGEPRGAPRGHDPRGAPRVEGGQRGPQRGPRAEGGQQRGDQRGPRAEGGQRGGEQRGQRTDGSQRGPRTDGGQRTDRGQRGPRTDGGQRTEGGQRGEPRGPRDSGGGASRELAASSADADRAERTAPQTFDAPTTRLEPRRPVAPADDLDVEGPSTPAIAWGTDDDGPPADVVLAPDLPIDAPADDLDPVTHPLLELPSAPLGDDIASVAGVRFVPGGRIQWCDAGDADYRQGERVMVDAERGARLAWIAVPPARRAVRDRAMRRVIRRASDQDLRGERDGDADRAHALRVAKDKAAALRLPLKVFRVEVLGQLGRGARVNVYYTTDDRLDLRDFIRDVSQTIGGRIELRQLGVRDEAKAVGGIGSCGLTLCCTTWLPDFVPVSIKMAKDQGLVLSPTKVSGQCGRLKCCLVYEQAAYAELRKGLPKLGKRVIAARGEGRVVEVDVLRQRVRVSYGAGDTEVVPASEVKPLFPSGNQPSTRSAEPDDSAESADGDETDDPSALGASPAGEPPLPDEEARDLPEDPDGDPADDPMPDDDPSSAP